jgi:uncharacterized membrane protein
MSDIPPVVPPAAPVSDVNDNDKLMAALSYFFTPIVGIIVLLVDTMKVRPYQKYHAIQSIGLFVAEIVFYVLACVLYVACTTVSLGFLGFCLWVVFFIPLIPNIYYTYLAYAKPSYFEIPVLTKFMVQQGWLSSSLPTV